MCNFRLSRPYKQALEASTIAQIIGCIDGMTEPTVIFPYQCQLPRHGVHLGCYIYYIMMQINRPPGRHLPLELQDCQICRARPLRRIIRSIVNLRLSHIFPHALFPSQDNRGVIVQARGLCLELTEEEPRPIFPPVHCAMCREDNVGHNRLHFLNQLFTQISVARL